MVEYRGETRLRRAVGLRGGSWEEKGERVACRRWPFEDFDPLAVGSTNEAVTPAEGIKQHLKQMKPKKA